MSSSALRIMAVLLAVGAAVLGYIGYQASHDARPIENALIEPSEVEPETYPLVIAAKDIPAEKKITAEDIKLIMVDKPIGESFTELEPLIGLTSRMAISTDDMILPAHFHSFSAVTDNLHPGERAIAVKVDEVTGVGGFIEPGDKVDVLLFLPAGQETGKESSAQLLLPALRVIAYGNQLAELDQQQIRQKSRAYLSAAKANPISELLPENESAENQGDPSGKQSKTAVLAVNQSLASTLLLAESTGRIRLALAGAGGEVSNTENLPNQASAENQNYFISLEALKGKPVESVAPISNVAPLSINSSPKRMPAQVTVHRGSQQTIINIDQEK